MSLERYVVRRETGGPDLEWVAEVDFDPALDRGEIRYSGGLEGLTVPLPNRLALEARFSEWATDGAVVDRIP